MAQLQMTSSAVAFIVLVAFAASSSCSSVSVPSSAPRTSRSAVLQHLRGGQQASMILRLNTKDGTKRITTPGGHTTLLELRQLIREQLFIPPSKQLVSLKPGGDTLDLTGEQTLAELGLKHGSTLHLARDVGVETVSSARAAAARRPAGARRVSVDVTKEMTDKRLNRVKIVAAPPAVCKFTSIDPKAWENFAAYLVDMEMEEMRVALLYGRVASGAEGDGVQVDVFYEPPQEATASGFTLLEGKEALAQRRRADQVAKALGLQLVGWAFAHPPRAHDVSVAELQQIAPMQKLADGESDGSGSGGGSGGRSSGAAAKDAGKGKSFVTMRVRCVYEHEDIDGDVTAEVYQPTEQCVKLLAQGSLVPAAKKPGHAAFKPELDQDFELDGEPTASVEAVYLLSRVHDMARPYSSPLHTGFPPANRAGGVMRKLHLRNLLTRARDAGTPFQATATDFHFLLHAASLLPEDALLALCKAVSAGRGGSTAALLRAETLLCEYAGMEPPKAASKKGK